MEKNRIRVPLTNFQAKTFQMEMEIPGAIEDVIIKTGSWEPKLPELLYKYLPDDSVFLDVGANIGYHSLYIASLNPKVTTICFEPHPKICQLLIQNVLINNFTNIIVHNQAVGNATQTLDFYMQTQSSYNMGLSSIFYDKYIGDDYEKISVNVVTLDSFLNEQLKSKVRVIKIDVQGSEYQVLQGAVNLISQFRPIITFEHHIFGPGLQPELQDLIQLLPDYNVYKFHPWSGEIRKLEEPNPQGYLGDYICIPQTQDIFK